MRKLETLRVNTRISLESNAWLDKRSIDSGISKSSLIQIAVEAYIKAETGQSEKVDTDLVDELKAINAKLDVLQMRIKD